MAWLKNIEDESTGAIIPYWEVIGVYYNHRLQLSTLEVGGWFSKETYENNKMPSMVRRWEIPSGLQPQLASGAVSFVSGYAKSQPEFEGYEEVESDE
jgi:hypothetical protein